MDKDLKCIKYYSLCDKPNIIHYFLATMINRGHFVITTNFDCLIEYALINLEVPITDILPIITKEDYKRYDNPYKIIDNGMKAIYKIHGSYKNVITQESTKNSLMATISSLGKGRKGMSLFQFEPEKIPLLEKILTKRSLVVLGYSGSDDFDVIPTLKYMKNIWLF